MGTSLISGGYPASTTPTQYYAYTASNDDTGEITSVKLDTTSLKPVNTSTTTSSTAINLIDVTPDGKFLVVASSTLRRENVPRENVPSDFSDLSTGGLGIR